LDHDGKIDMDNSSVPLAPGVEEGVEMGTMTNAQKKKEAYYCEFDNQHEAIRGKIRTMNALVDMEDA